MAGLQHLGREQYFKRRCQLCLQAFLDNVQPDEGGLVEQPSEVVVGVEICLVAVAGQVECHRQVDLDGLERGGRGSQLLFAAAYSTTSAAIT
ncbi:MAG TPA: hypothetical protein VFC03_01195 [Acidimicrobiales bacterium]|nr:hypothetical protein [Acidimicrobiales bacterium]